MLPSAYDRVVGWRQIAVLICGRRRDLEGFGKVWEDVTVRARKITPSQHLGGRRIMQRQSALYQEDAPFLDFDRVTPDTPLSQLNLNWRESDLPERVRTKHVHRLHPYLGKFIPQLVEIFLRKFARRCVLDPFMGSGTTLVEANALGLDSVGCDISEFNCMLARVKTMRYDLPQLETELLHVLQRAELLSKDDSLWRDDLVGLEGTSDGQATSSGPDSSYVDHWFAPRARKELLAYRSLISEQTHANVMRVILSRAARSARLTTHFDLDFPKEPVTAPYYCYKHRRTCQPTDRALSFLKRYTLDTIRRVSDFAALRIDADVKVMWDDSRTADFGPVDCVVTSPPYVGLIDYHEQHRYAFELLGLSERKGKEIGCADRGRSTTAVQRYLQDIEAVFLNVKRHLEPGGHVVVIVFDKSGYYPNMANRLGFEQVEVLERHVNRRTGLRNGEFFEQIYIWRNGGGGHGV